MVEKEKKTNADEETSYNIYTLRKTLSQSKTTYIFNKKYRRAATRMKHNN